LQNAIYTRHDNLGRALLSSHAGLNLPLLP